MIDYRKIIKNRELRLKLIRMLSWIPDRPYIKMVYRIKTGKAINLDNPKGFNEKLNWLKINNRNPEYTTLVDKLKVRDYIEKTIGKDYLFPLIGSWKHFDDIDFDSLPDQFVLKCNHDSGSVKVITDKSTINKEELKKFFEGRLKINPFCLSREYPYRDVEPYIIAEKFMKTSDGAEDLKDYKFYCFNGEPKFLYLSEGLSNHDTAKISYVTLDWKIAPFKRNDFEPFTELPENPKHLDEMIELCKKLAVDMPFVRIDLYEIDDRIYFGEFTYFPSGGYTLMDPIEWEIKVGDYLVLPNNI